MSDIEKITRRSILIRRTLLPFCFSFFFFGLACALFASLAEGQWMIVPAVLLYAAPLVGILLLNDRWTRGWVVDIIPTMDGSIQFRRYKKEPLTVDQSQVIRVVETWVFYVFTLRDKRKLWFYRLHGGGFRQVLDHPAVHQCTFPYAEMRR